MKKYLTSALFALIFAAACGEKSPQQPDDTAKPAADILQAYTGTYGGILPCADCEGIDTEITLNPDNTFTLIEFYLSKESDLYLTEGTWKLSPDKRYAILVSADDKQNPLNIYYALKDGDLLQLDINARPIESNLNYYLRRK
jgi:uncharacterized lipoprotein NlpE involved in copper resistance